MKNPTYLPALLDKTFWSFYWTRKKGQILTCTCPTIDWTPFWGNILIFICLWLHEIKKVNNMRPGTPHFANFWRSWRISISLHNNCRQSLLFCTTVISAWFAIKWSAIKWYIFWYVGIYFKFCLFCISDKNCTGLKIRMDFNPWIELWFFCLVWASIWVSSDLNLSGGLQE